MVSGFLKVASAVPSVRIADCQYNVQQIIDRMAAAEDDGVALCVLPELCITGYTCGDLFGQPYFIAAAESALDDVLSLSHTMNVMAVVGLPIQIDGRLYNCAVVIREGKIYGAVPKTYLPNYNEFYEARWFTSGAELPHGTTITLCGQEVPIDTNLLFRSGAVCFGIEICEDMWSPIPPSSYLALAGANVILNPSASNDMVGKHAYRKQLVVGQSARCMAAYVYSSCGFGESTTDIVFAGSAIIAENGAVLSEGNRFLLTPQNVVAEVDIDKLQSQRMRVTTFRNYSNEERQYTTINVNLKTEYEEHEISRAFDPHPFIPSNEKTMDENCAEIFNIQTNGLAQRFIASHSKCAVVGISGGLDSTLALLVAVKTMDKLKLPREKIIGVTMPGFGTTDRTYNNAVGLIKALGADFREVSIRSACEQHFKDINLDPNDRSVTYENSQARERTQILMDIANKEGGIVVGTGDLSELALGWATYNGDHMSMYGVNAGVPKTLVRHLVQFVADKNVEDEITRKILLDIIDTPISPELLPADKNGKIAQKTEDLVGPYELHDFYLYNFVRFGYAPKRLIFMAVRAFDGKYSDEVATKWLKVFFKRFFAQQFKRSALPDGPKVGSVSLSPRGDWRMPSDASANLWLSQLQDD
ncbi:MAG: NAD(+) synthase [Marinilabiliaceae bacterium]|nr:NAD(+) synthase [Marinilabiliaceae bacterium]